LPANFLSLIFGTLSAVIFALLVNELMNMSYKRIVQTLSYLPHFISWVVVAGLYYSFFSISKDAPINSLLLSLGIIKNPIPFFMKGEYFWGLVTFAELWKETGWSAIIYLAVIAGIDIQLYEAAYIDGANRLRRIWHITLPGIKGTVVILTVLSVGWLIGRGFDKSFLMGNPVIAEYSEVISVYTFRYGIKMLRFSYGTAVGMFQSVVGIAMVLVANYFATKVNEKVF